MSNIKSILVSLDKWCRVNNIVVASVYDACHGMTLQELVYYLFGVVKESLTDVDNLEDDFASLKEYVNDYFNNLDLQNEINTALENMGESGELGDYLNRIFMKNKRIAWFGDSLIYGDSGDELHSQVETPIPTHFQEVTGCISYNYARNGAHMCNYQAGTNTLQNQLNTNSITNCDYVVIGMGYNDCANNAPIGDYNSNDWNYFSGALNNAINYIHTQAPGAIVIVLGIFPSNRYLNQIKNTYGVLIDSYDYALKKCCEISGARYINMLSLGVNVYNYTSFTVDGTHYTQAGYNLLAEHIANNIGGGIDYGSVGDNLWNKNNYPSSDNYGVYSIVDNSVHNQYTTFQGLVMSPGTYMISFDYECEYSVYNTDSTQYGILIRTVSGSPVILCQIGGFSNGTGHVDIVTVVGSGYGGTLGIREITNNTNCVNLTINNFVVRVVGRMFGHITYNNNMTVNSDYLDNNIEVQRSEWNVCVKGYGNITSAYTANQPFATSGGLARLINSSSDRVYFPFFYTRSGVTNIARASIIGTTMSVSATLQVDDIVAFYVTW